MLQAGGAALLKGSAPLPVAAPAAPHCGGAAPGAAEKPYEVGAAIGAPVVHGAPLPNETPLPCVAIPCCAAEATCVAVDNCATPSPFTVFATTALPSKLPVTNCPVLTSNHDTGCESAIKGQPAPSPVAAPNDRPAPRGGMPCAARSPNAPREYSRPFFGRNCFFDVATYSVCPGHRLVPRAQCARCNPRC